MYRGILIALLSGVILLAFAALPPMLPGSTTAGLSGSAQAEKAPTPTTDAIKLNTSRSNIYRMGGGGGAKAGGAAAAKVQNPKGNQQYVPGQDKDKKLAPPKGNQLNPQPEPPGSKRK